MNKKMVIIVIILLVAVVGVTAFLNRGSIAEKENAQKEALVTFKEAGNEVETVSMSFVKKQGETTFSKDLDTSDSGPEEHTYTGVPLKNVISEVDINLEDKSQVVVKAIDGYTVALTAKEVREDDNVYLIYQSDGEPLKSKKEGGTGPYRLVIKNDQFGQRWCKFVTEVNVK